MYSIYTLEQIKHRFWKVRKILEYKMIKHAPIRRRTLILDDARHLGQQYSYSWIMNVEHSD